VISSVADIGRDYLSADVDVRLGNELRLALLRHLQRLTVGSLVGFVGVLNLLGQSAFRLSESFSGWLSEASRA
jgi:hypothetical protein